jgi:hypothetical protein
LAEPLAVGRKGDRSDERKADGDLREDEDDDVEETDEMLARVSTCCCCCCCRY